MDPYNPKNLKPPFRFTGERIALMLGGTLIGVLAIVFTFKLATPIVKKACQSILQAPDTANRDVRIASVEAVVLKPGTISKRITTIGKLRANEFVTLHTEMQGRIKQIDFKEGTMVKKGDVLIRFEDEELQAELAKAEADVEYRQVKFDRMQKPEFKGFTRGHEYDQERGNLNIAKAAVELAKAKLAKATITAPFDGKIGLINVSVGAFVDTQKELVTIVDFDPMKIEFKIPEIHIHDIGVGQTAEVKLDSFPDQIFKATVEAVDSRVDPQTHSIAVRASIPNEDGKLQTGLFGSVSVIIGVKNDALVVPESALGREGEIEYVWVVVNGKAGRKRVLTGTKENGQAEITAGLREGEIVVTSGQLKLGEGSAVKISNMGTEEVEITDEEEGPTGSKQASASPKEAKASPEETAAKPSEPSKEEKTQLSSTPAPKTDESPAKETPSTASEPSGEQTTMMPSPVEPKSAETLPKEEQKKDEPESGESLPQQQGAGAGAATATPALPTISPGAAQTNTQDRAGAATEENAPKIESAPQASTTPTSEPQAKDPVIPQTDSLKDPSQPLKNMAESGAMSLKLQDSTDVGPLENEDKASFFTSLFTKARDFVVNLFKRS